MTKSKKGMLETAAVPTQATKPKARASFYLEKQFKLPNVEVDSEASITVSGKVVGVRADQFGHSFDLEIKSIHAGEGSMREDLKTLREQRKLK